MVAIMQRMLQFFSCSAKTRPSTAIPPKRYRLVRVIGVPGTFGTVFLGESVEQQVAIKRVSLQYKQQELDLFQTIVHPNVVRYLGSYESKKHVYIVMEKCEQDLFDLVVTNGGKLSEREAMRYIVQIVQALQYLHRNGIVHGDIKLCNIMLDASDTIKLIDFGTAQRVRPGEQLHDFTGSIAFLAPEVIQGAYTTARDMWSLGCVAFILLFGYNPFNPTAKESTETIVQNILKGFQPHKPVDGITPLAMDFIRQLLESDWRNRMTTEEALRHPWISV